MPVNDLFPFRFDVLLKRVMFLSTVQMDLDN